MGFEGQFPSSFLILPLKLRKLQVSNFEILSRAFVYSLPLTSSIYKGLLRCTVYTNDLLYCYVTGEGGVVRDFTVIVWGTVVVCVLSSIKHFTLFLFSEIPGDGRQH